MDYPPSRAQIVQCSLVEFSTESSPSMQDTSAVDFEIFFELLCRILLANTLPIQIANYCTYISSE